MDKIFDELTAFEQEKERTIKSLTTRLDACEKELAARRNDQKTFDVLRHIERRMNDEVAKYLVPDSAGVLVPQNFEDAKMKDIGVYVKSLFDHLCESHCDLSTFINHTDDVAQTPSSSSSSEEVETIGAAFKKRVEELGIEWSFIEALFAIGDTHATGGVVAQVLLKERWDVDNLIFVCLAVDGCFHPENYGIRPTCVEVCDAVGHRWLRYTYIKSGWAVPVAVHVPVSRVSQTIHDATHVLSLDFVKSFFDGKKVRIPNIQSLIRKHHRVSESDRTRYFPLIEKFTPLGFSFSDMIHHCNSTAVFNANDPSNLIKKLQ